MSSLLCFAALSLFSRTLPRLQRTSRPLFLFTLLPLSFFTLRSLCSRALLPLFSFTLLRLHMGSGLITRLRISDESGCLVAGSTG